MELELGLKITRTREDVSSSVDFRFSKDPFGPLVLSRETDSRFIIIIHLKGFKKEGIEIEINDEGNRITIRGRKAVEEIVMVRWMAWRKEVELREFRKVFRIPDIVDLDLVKARFDEDDATLTITMPKIVKGISGFTIEEEEESDEQSETDLHREEESQVLEDEEANLEEIQKHDEILQFIQVEEEIGEQGVEQELVNSDAESEEGSDTQEKTRHEEQITQQVGELQETQAATKSDDFESRAVEEIEEEGPDELDTTGKTRAKEEENTTDDDSQPIEEREIHNDQSKSQEVVEGETGDDGKEGKEKKKTVKPEIKNGDPKGEVDGEIGERFTPNVAETEEFVSDKLEGDELVEKKEEEEENAKMGTKREDISLPELQETEEQHFYGEKPRSKQGKIKELVEEETPEAETNIGNKVPEVDTFERREGKHKLFEEETNGRREAYKGKITETGKKTNDADSRKVQEIRQTMRDDRQENNKEVVEQYETQAETKSDDFGSRAFEQIEERAPDELDRTSKTRATKKTTNDHDDNGGYGLSKVQGVKEPDKRNKESKIQEMLGLETGDEGKEKKIVKLETKNEDAKEEVDANMDEGFTPSIAETETKDEEFESDKLEADKVDKIHELVEKEEENAKVGTKSGDISLVELQEIEEQHSKGKKQHRKREETKELVEEQNLETDTNNQQELKEEKTVETGKKINDAGSRKVQETRQQELYEPARCEKENKTRESMKSKTKDEEKETAKTETKEKESYRPKALVEQEKIQELAEEKTNFSKNGEVKELEETAEKKTEIGDDDDYISRKVGDIEKQDSDEVKGQEEKGEIQELVLEEKVSDDGKGFITMAETIAESDKSRKVQDTDEEQSLKEDKRGKNFQKLTGGKISSYGEVEDVENEKKTVEADKRIKESTREAQEIEKKDLDVTGKYGKGDTIQELHESKATYRKKQEEEKDEVHRSGKIAGKIEQELVNLNRQLKQENIEEGEKTLKLVEEETKDKGSEESKTKADYDAVRKVQGFREELYEPKRDHKELVDEKIGYHEKEEEKEIAESEIEAQCGSLRKVNGSEEQELRKPNIHKERDKTRITGGEEQSGQKNETEDDSSTNVQEIKPERGHSDIVTVNFGLEKRYKMEDVVEVGHSDRKQEQQGEKVIPKAEWLTDEDSSKRFQEYDGLNKVQGIEKPERQNEGKTDDDGIGEEETNKIVKMEIKDGVPKEKVDEKMGERFTPNIAETETKAEFGSDKLEENEVDKMHELVEKKEVEGENAKVRRQSGDISLISPQGTEEQHSKGQNPHTKQELEEEKKPEAETNIVNDILKPLQERCEGKQKIQKNIQEDTNNQREEYEEKVLDTGKKIDDADPRKVQEIRQQVLNEPTTSEIRESVKSKTNDEEKDIAETETEEKEPSRPKIVKEQDKIQELVEEKTNFSENGKIKEEEIVQRDPGAMRGQEEKDKIQELVLGEKISDGGKGITAVVETIVENDEARKVQEIDKQQSYEEDACGKRFQKLRGGETSDHGEVGDVQNEKKTIEADKRIKEIIKEAQEIEKNDSDVSEKYGKGDMIKNIQENRATYRNEQEEEKDEAHRPEKITGKIEQQLVNLNSQLEQENIEGEKTQEVVEEETKDCKEEAKKEDKGIEESKTKTDDKIQGIREQESYGPDTDHVSKIKELVEEKTGDNEKEEEKEIAEEIEAECGSLRKVHGSEEHELNEPKIHKERDETQLIGAEPSGQEKETENENSTNVQEIKQESHEKRYKTQEVVEAGHNDHKEEQQGEKVISQAEREIYEDSSKKVQEIEKQDYDENENSLDVQEVKEERSEKPESHEKRYKIKEVVEAGHNHRKEEKQEEKVIADAERETDENSKIKVQEIEKQEDDELKSRTVQDKTRETEENDKTRAMEEKRIKSKDGSLRKDQDDEDPETSKPYKKREEDKIQELVEMGTSDHREKVKKQNVNIILRNREAGRPDLDEFGRHGEESSIPQLVDEEKTEYIVEPEGKMEDDNSGKFHEFEERESYENWTHEEREKLKDLVKEEATDPKDKHTGGQGQIYHREEEQEGKVIAKAELETKEDSSEKVQEVKKQESDESKKSIIQDKKQEPVEKIKTREMQENDFVARGKKTKDGSLRKVQEGEDPELDRHKKIGKEDWIQELVELEISDHRGKVKKKDWDEILRSRETGKPDLDELESDSSGQFHEFQKQKSNEDQRPEGSEEIENVVKEKATVPKDKHTGGQGGEEEERYEKVTQTTTKIEDEIYKKVREDKELQSAEQEQCRQLREQTSDCEKEEEKLVDEFTGEIQETGKEKSHESEGREKVDEESEEAAAVVAKNEDAISRKVQMIELQLEEPEKDKEQKEILGISDHGENEEDKEKVAEKEEVPNSSKVREINEKKLEVKLESCKDGNGKGMRAEKGKQGKSVETRSRERFKAECEDQSEGKIRETKEQESNGKKNQKQEYKTEELERKETSKHEAKLMNEDDGLNKGKEFLEKESNVSKKRPVEQETIQELKQVGKREDEEKAEVETKNNDSKSRMSEKQGLGESEENEEHKEIQKPMEEKTHALEKSKEGNDKIAEEEMRDKIDRRIKDQEIIGQESYEILQKRIRDKMPELIVKGKEYHREEEKGMKETEIEELKKIAEDVSSRKVQQAKEHELDELKKHRKPSEIIQKHNIQESLDHGAEEMNERGEYKAGPQPRSFDLSHLEDAEEKGPGQPKRYAEQEKIQQLKPKEERKEKYIRREIREQAEKAKRIPQVELETNDDRSRKSKIEEHESTRLNGQKKKEKHQEPMNSETSDRRKEEKEEEVVGKAETKTEYDSSRKIYGNEERKSDKPETHKEEEMCEKLAEEETSDDKEGNRAGEKWGEGETKIKDDSFGKVRETEEQELAIVVRHIELDKRQSPVEKDRSGKPIENKTKSGDDSTRKTRDNEKQESHEQGSDEHDQKKKLGLVGEKTNYRRNEEDGKDAKGIVGATAVPGKLKGIEKRESTDMAERHENQGNIEELVEETLNNQEGKDKKSMIREILAKAEDQESKETEGLSKQDKTREPVKQRLTDNPKDEETSKAETKSKEKESRKIHQIKEEETSEQERLKEQGRIKELVEDRKHYYRETELEDCSLEKIQEIDKEESIKPGRYEKQNKILEPVDMETSEDDEEEVEVEFEDEEEDWEAEVIQAIDSDEDNEKNRKIRKLKVGFQLVGGSALFMSLIVIVIKFIRSKRKIRCYKL